jgi:site-specific DNA-cytosine methylase
MKKPTALGLYSGIGSMLCAARQSGFKIIGNIEPRSYFHTGTFEKNFPEAEMARKYEAFEFRDTPQIDVVFAHPSCGNHSSLNTTGKKENKNKDPGDIPNLIKYLISVRPRFFVIDNLPKMLNVVPMSVWRKAFPDYDVVPELVSNYHYGNAQLKRVRLFIIGSLKKEKFRFKPGEEEWDVSVKDVIGDLLNLPNVLPNHCLHTLKNLCLKATHMKKRHHRSTWKEVRDYFRDKSEGYVLRYHNNDDDKESTNLRPGFKKTYWNKHCHVLIGTNPCVHPKTNLPLSLRERLRLMGFPDNFVLVGTKLEKDGTWDHTRNSLMIRQTGKCVPLEFVRYLSKQIRYHIEGREFRSSGVRLHKSNSIVDNQR